MVDFVAGVLGTHGIRSRIIRDESGLKANLFATIGPEDEAGVILSGHSDVVPVAGQSWSVPPFAMTARDGRIYGRGAADMKGFVAAAIAACIRASKLPLKAPLHLALSHDEEIGCVGVRSLLRELRQAPRRAALCIVGEPTAMRVATGHKGKLSAEVVCTGREGHSALAPFALNALHLGCDFVGALRRQQQELAETGARDEDYTVPYTTVHAGTMSGGVALNIVPGRCAIAFEIRNLATDDPEAILASLRARADALAGEAAAIAPEAAIEIAITNTYPALDTPADSAAVAFVQALAQASGTTKVAFGTEAGLFSRDLGVPTVVCGPGSMEQGHKPDEFIATEQLERCDAMLERLALRLTEAKAADLLARSGI